MYIFNAMSLKSDFLQLQLRMTTHCEAEHFFGAQFIKIDPPYHLV